MMIKTEFNVDDVVVFIYNNKIMSRKIHAVEYVGCKIRYNLMLSKGMTSLDKDRHVVLYEDDCFRSVKELCDYYEAIDITK